MNGVSAARLTLRNACCDDFAKAGLAGLRAERSADLMRQRGRHADRCAVELLSYHHAPDVCLLLEQMAKMCRSVDTDPVAAAVF